MQHIYHQTEDYVSGTVYNFYTVPHYKIILLKTPRLNVYMENYVNAYYPIP